MRLVFQSVDMRGGYPEKMAWQNEVVDEESGKTVGFLYEETKPARRIISLFGGKYQGEFKDSNHCHAFVKGVEAVLNHMTVFDGEQAASAEAAE
jgi:hypothetical protein